jgi:hypothetical protein
MLADIGSYNLTGPALRVVWSLHLGERQILRAHLVRIKYIKILIIRLRFIPPRFKDAHGSQRRPLKPLTSPPAIA